MKLNVLPTTGVRLSQLTLGTMMFGGQTSEADSLKIMDLALDSGINSIDTANMYTGGESERIVGKALKGRRDKAILATKVSHAISDDPNDVGLSRRSILGAVEKSLKRLDTDYIDLYYLHWPDYHTPIEESLYTLDMLVKAGKVRYAAISNFAAWQAADALHVSNKRGYTPPVISQNVYNLLTRGLEAEFLPFVKAHPIGLAIYNPIAGGLLAGKHGAGAPDQDTRFAQNKIYYDRYWSQENFDAVEKLKGIAAQAGISLLELSYRWVAQHPQVTTIISGVSRLEQLEQNLKLLDGPALSEDTLSACDDVWHGLAGTRFKYNR